MKIKILFTSLLMFIGFLPMNAQFQFEQTTELFLMHSSANHLKMDEAKGGRLEAPNVSDPQTITVIPDGKGYYSLKAANASLFLSLSGSWKTLFIADSSSSNA